MVRETTSRSQKQRTFIQFYYLLYSPEGCVAFIPLMSVYSLSKVRQTYQRREPVDCTGTTANTWRAGHYTSSLCMELHAQTLKSPVSFKYELVCVSSELFLIGRRTWLPKNWLNQRSPNDVSLRDCVWFDVGGACISIGRLQGYIDVPRGNWGVGNFGPYNFFVEIRASTNTYIYLYYYSRGLWPGRVTPIFFSISI